jgi:hypothetical protein
VTAREEDYLWAAVNRCLQERVTVTGKRDAKNVERHLVQRPLPTFSRGKKEIKK